MFEGKPSCQYMPGQLFRDPHSNSQLVCKPKHSKEPGLRALVELVTHRCRSSIYGLAMIWELSLNAALGMKRIHSIIME